MLRTASRAIDGIDDLRHLVHGSQVDLVQLDPGRLRGEIRHVSSAQFGLSIGSFSHGVRGRGVFGSHQATIGLALSSSGPMSQWAYKCHPDDLIVCPPGSDHESSYRGPVTICTLSLSPDMLANHFANEGSLQDQDYWHRIRRIHIDPQRAEHMRQSLSQIVSLLMAPHKQRFDPDYVRRAAAEAFGLAFLHAGTADSREPILAAAKIVRQAEDFVEGTGFRAVHVSELCAALNVTRRSLHRAFSETLGIGPIAYLRQRRLSAIHSALRRSDPSATTVMDVAAEHGFSEFGRFAAYYRQLFDEYPAQTLRRMR